jgi:hypothetical protein
VSWRSGAPVAFADACPEPQAASGKPCVALAFAR